MENTAPRPRREQPVESTGSKDPSTRRLRRVLVAVGLVLAVLIVVAAAIYAAAFIMLAPMMQ